MWFAFKLYLWRIEKQQYVDIICASFSCDLLSNCIFDVLKNNFLIFKLSSTTVVICFQIVSLTYWKTTCFVWPPSLLRLWFAFKLYLWRIEKQPTRFRRETFSSCDLLSNCIFDVLKNNLLQRWWVNACVVICFQIVSLTYWKTTKTAIKRLK